MRWSQAPLAVRIGCGRRLALAEIDPTKDPHEIATALRRHHHDRRAIDDLHLGGIEVTVNPEIVRDKIRVSAEPPAAGL